MKTAVFILDLPWFSRQNNKVSKNSYNFKIVRKQFPFWLPLNPHYRPFCIFQCLLIRNWKKFKEKSWNFWMAEWSLIEFFILLPISWIELPCGFNRPLHPLSRLVTVFVAKPSFTNSKFYHHLVEKTVIPSNLYSWGI